MKVRVRLFGTLRQGFPDYQHSQGMEVEIPDGSTVKDLLTILKVSESRGAAVIAEGRVLKASDEMRPGALVNVVQSIGGG